VYPRYHQHVDALTSIVVTPTLTSLLTSSLDRTVRLYDVVHNAAPSLVLKATLEGHPLGVRQVCTAMAGND
jgi:hypothetical protein